MSLPLHTELSATSVSLCRAISFTQQYKLAGMGTVNAAKGESFRKALVGALQLAVPALVDADVTIGAITAGDDKVTATVKGIADLWPLELVQQQLNVRVYLSARSQCAGVYVFLNYHFLQTL